jgi:deoxyadenosine/deoxycytidine kinase
LPPYSLSSHTTPKTKQKHAPQTNQKTRQAFYSDPRRYAFSFQNYVFLSRVMQERGSAATPRAVRLMERSVFSDRMVFVRAVRESGWMGDVELVRGVCAWFGLVWLFCFVRCVCVFVLGARAC